MGIKVVMDSKRNLFQVVCALHSSCRFTGGLNGGQKKRDQNSDDRYHDKKLNKRKASHIAPPPQIDIFVLQTNHRKSPSQKGKNKREK